MANKPRIKARAEWTTITAAIAQKWLEIDTSNRNLSQAMVDKYAAEMKAGNWDEDNGETIKIAPDGGVLDGQHRLWAIFQSGVTLRLLVVFDVDKDCFKTIDIGKIRTPGDVVGIAGVKNPNVVAGAAAIAIAIESKKYGLETHSPTKNISRSSLIDYCVKNQAQLEESARQGNRVGIGKMLSGSSAAACHYLFVTRSKAADRGLLANAFFEQLGSGLFDNRFAAGKSPIFVLREKLMANRMSVSRMQAPALIGLTIKAWNAYISSRSVGVLRVVAGESFPAVA